MKCETCLHKEICKACIPIFGMDKVACQYEAHELVGEWIHHKEWELDGECAFECSKCGMGADVDYNFCPNCGASMSANYRQITGKLNSEIEKSKSEIVPDYRDGWRLREGDGE